MDIEAALYTQLSTHAGLAALVGARIYPDYLPPTNTQAAVVFERKETEVIHAMGADPGLEGALYKFSCHGPTKPDAKAVAAQVRAALKDYSGVMGGVTVERVFLDDEYDDEPTGTASDAAIKTRQIRAVEFLIWYHV